VKIGTPIKIIVVRNLKEQYRSLDRESRRGPCAGPSWRSKMERWDKCKKIGYRGCPPDVRLVAEALGGNRPTYLDNLTIERAKEACENCQHYVENKVWSVS
jgi:hypothetical protein